MFDICWYILQFHMGWISVSSRDLCQRGLWPKIRSARSGRATSTSVPPVWRAILAKHMSKHVLKVESHTFWMVAKKPELKNARYMRYRIVQLLNKFQCTSCSWDSMRCRKRSNASHLPPWKGLKRSRIFGSAHFFDWKCGGICLQSPHS